jgi:hypothetical protein
MSDELDSRVRADFSRARFKSFINQVFSVLSGKRTTTLLSYDEIKENCASAAPFIGE